MYRTDSMNYGNDQPVTLSGLWNLKKSLFWLITLRFVFFFFLYVYTNVHTFK
jgi:hypothetical protein